MDDLTCLHRFYLQAIPRKRLHTFGPRGCVDFLSLTDYDKLVTVSPKHDCSITRIIIVINRVSIALFDDNIFEIAT